jgi:hypothetical protein
MTATNADKLQRDWCIDVGIRCFSEMLSWACAWHILALEALA